MRIYGFILAATLICFGCTSARKASRYNLPPDPGMGGVEAVEAAPSLLRQEAIKLSPVGTCDTSMVKRVRVLALKRWPKVGCPERFGDLLTKFEPSYSSEERSVLRALERIDCQGQGLISIAEGTSSLADGLKDFLERKVPAEVAEGRFTASAEGEAQLLQVLERVMALNVPRERQVSSQGEFILPEAQLQSIVGLVRNGCRLRNIESYYDRDRQILAAMETNESLLLEPALRQEYISLREGLRRIFSQQIRSYF